MNGNGFVKVFRKMTEWGWYTDGNTCRVFFHCLFMANYKPTHWRDIDMLPGQFITSLPSLSKQLGISIQSVRTALDHLKSTGEITYLSTNKFRLITVANWALYQSEEDEVTDKTTDESTDSQQTTNRQLTAVKEDKKIRTINKSIYCPKWFPDVWKEYPRREGKNGITKQAYADLEESGREKVLYAIGQYKEKIKKQQIESKFVLMGSTFFNGRYKDYLTGYEDQERDIEKEMINTEIDLFTLDIEELTNSIGGVSLADIGNKKR